MARRAKTPQAHRFWKFGRSATQDESTDPNLDALSQEEAPASLKPAGSVLCIGARGPLDDAAAAMLAKVLGAYGMGASSEGFETLSKTEIEALDVSHVRLICLSCLDGSTSAFLRFVLRRLRRRAPHAKILLATWWRRSGLRDSDEELDEVIRLPKASTIIDVVRFCLAQRDDEAHAQPAPAARLDVAS